MDRLWERRRAEALDRLKEHAARGLVDEDILEWLLLINEKDCLFTSSSCSGRVVLLEGEDFFGKREARILWAEHSPLQCLNWARILPGTYETRLPTSRRYVWLSLQPPVIHFHARSEEVALAIVECARRSGFVRACYRREHEWYFVEVSAHDKMHLLLPAPVEAVADMCRVLARYKDRLRRFKECSTKKISMVC